jgi:hypothetical protein
MRSSWQIAFQNTTYFPLCSNTIFTPQIWFDFQDYNQATYRKQNQEAQGSVFIPEYGIVPKLSAANPKELRSNQQQKIEGKVGKLPKFYVMR